MMTRLKRACWHSGAVLALLLFLLNLALPGLAAPWVQTTSLPDGYAGHSLVYSSGYLYQAGGATEMNGFGWRKCFLRSSSQRRHDWNLENATPLPEGVCFHAGVTANGFVYVIGGNHFNDEGWRLLKQI